MTETVTDQLIRMGQRLLRLEDALCRPAAVNGPLQVYAALLTDPVVPLAEVLAAADPAPGVPDADPRREVEERRLERRLERPNPPSTGRDGAPALPHQRKTRTVRDGPDERGRPRVGSAGSDVLQAQAAGPREHLSTTESAASEVRPIQGRPVLSWPLSSSAHDTPYVDEPPSASAGEGVVRAGSVSNASSGSSPAENGTRLTRGGAGLLSVLRAHTPRTASLDHEGTVKPGEETYGQKPADTRGPVQPHLASMPVRERGNVSLPPPVEPAWSEHNQPSGSGHAGWDEAGFDGGTPGRSAVGQASGAVRPDELIEYLVDRLELAMLRTYGTSGG